MERMSRIALLLAITMLFWVWQSSQTVFDKALPFLDISNGGFYSFREAVKENQQLNSSSIIISVSEIVALYLGVATMASLYGLYSVCSDGQATFWQNLTFTGLVSITSAGYGMHVVCVIAQLQLSLNNQLYSLLDFVHERWSHNMFQFGIFGLLLLVIWAERPEFLPLKASPNCNRTDTIIKSKEPSALARLWLKGLGPVIAGLFTAVFANRTETNGAVLTFYISVLATFAYFVNHHKCSANVNVVSLVNQYVTLGFFVTATLVGLPTLLIHGWLL